MLESIRQYLLYKTIARQKREAKFISWNDIKNVLVLYESDLEMKNEGINEFIKLIRSEGKRVTAYGYLDQKLVETCTYSSQMIINKKDLNFLGRPKSDFISAQLRDNFDAVIDLTLNDIIPIQYMLGLAKATMKCGRHREDCKMYDFMIELQNVKIDEESGLVPLDKGEELRLGEQIIRYLKQLKCV